MAEMIEIARRYRGPPDSANGGYACGVLAMRLNASARVRLHRPPPLEQPLSIVTSDARAATLSRGELLIAEGTIADVERAVPEPVGLEVAARAAEHYRWFTGHPFPGCFVCGPDRRHSDGLDIFPGPVPERRIVAAPWTPDESVCDESGLVRIEVMWAALDCPSWFGLLEFESGASAGLLGQLAAQLVRRPRAGDSCVAIGWPIGRDGRKLFAGAALYTGEGELLGHSTALWIEPKQPLQFHT